LSQFNRAPHASDGDIEATWATKLATRPRLWDAAKFRLAGVRVNSPGTGPVVTLQLGLTSYKAGPCASSSPPYTLAASDPLACHSFLRQLNMSIFKGFGWDKAGNFRTGSKE
jgi:hypothetical protein